MEDRRIDVAPGLSLHQISDPPTLDEKVTVFARRVRGWQIDIAQHLANNVPHSGFAVLSILMSFPEMMWQYRHGESSGPRLTV